MTERRFRNGERIVYRDPAAGWGSAIVTGESPDGGAYIGEGKVDARLIGGAVPNFADAAALVDRLRELDDFGADPADRRAAWDGMWDALEEASVQRVPGILPGFQ